MKELHPDPGRVEPIHPRVAGRAKILLLVAGLLFLLLLLRIFLYQTLDYHYYQRKVIEQITTESGVTASRGSIYDRNGILLATNVSTYRVFISPSSILSAQVEMKESGEDVELDELIAQNLSAILDVSYEFVLKQTEYTRYLDRTIAREVDEDTADEVRAFIDSYGLQSMIYLQSTHSRYYPYSSLASHAIGFTGSDGTGLYGLEYAYNKLLAGTNGRYITARDAKGDEMPYTYKEYIPAQDGYDVHTTLDVYVQSALEEQLKSAYENANGQNRAAGIVMNVNTGEILGMGVYPSYDLNDPWTLDQQSADQLALVGYAEGSEEYAAHRQALLLQMWSNKSITESYIPGSTFKVITASMALEESAVTLSESFSCPGYKDVLGQKIKCHKKGGHGSLTFVEGIQQSCNPVLMTVGLRLGTANFYDYLKAFGFLERTGIDLPGEGVGVFAAEEAFTDLDLAIYAFGQNFNVTLVQQITAISAVANGGYLVTPHTVSSVKDGSGNLIESYGTSVRRQVVSSAVCQTVADILEKGVSGDGGAKNAYVAGYRIAAKTGTSEKKERECPICDSTASPKKINGETHYVCGICGYVGDVSEFAVSEDYVCSTVAFAPAENPQYAVIIIVDEPTSGTLYGSVVAAPYVANVMETILPYLGVEAVYTEEELKNQTVKVPNVSTYWRGSLAKKVCEQNGFTVEFVGDPDGVVYKQYPEPDTVVEKDSARIVLYTDKEAEESTAKVPNVVGLSPTAANRALINAGFNIRIEGTKNHTGGGVVAVSQSVPAGELLPRGTVIEVKFLYLEDTD